MNGYILKIRFSKKKIYILYITLLTFKFNCYMLINSVCEYLEYYQLVLEKKNCSFL